MFGHVWVVWISKLVPLHSRSCWQGLARVVLIPTASSPPMVKAGFGAPQASQLLRVDVDFPPQAFIPLYYITTKSSAALWGKCNFPVSLLLLFSINAGATYLIAAVIAITAVIAVNIVMLTTYTPDAKLLPPRESYTLMLSRGTNSSFFNNLLGRTAHIALIEDVDFARCLVWGVIRRSDNEPESDINTHFIGIYISLMKL
eukprot:scaffold199326_cov19-Tisochrysis_lutea.AAC.1